MPRGISDGTTYSNHNNNDNNNNKNIPTITNTAMTVVAVIVAGVGSHMWYSRLEKRLRGMLQPQPATLPCARQCAFGPFVSAAAGIDYRSACQWHMCLSACSRKTMNC